LSRLCEQELSLSCLLYYLQNESRHAVSTLCASCVAFGDKCQAPCSSRSSLRLFSVGWNTVTACWSDFRDIITKRYQSVQNASARLIFGIDAQNTLPTPSLRQHWLHIFSKVAILNCRAYHGSTPRYTSSCFTRVADKPSRRRLRSSSSNQLATSSFLPPPVAGAYLWNDFLRK